MKLICLPFILMAFALSANAEEGMWLLNDFPTQAVAKNQKFTATPQWLEHVRLSSARLAGGCSGSFVSKNGLVMTNHHCAHSCIEQLSKPGDDRVANGYYAKAGKDEVRCPEIEVNRLTNISDVTDVVKGATKGLSGKAFNDAQKAKMSALEKDCSKGADDLRCDVVTLYHGGKYHLYKYKRYQDVRLVFAPEFPIAFFGGDPDNFNFPRYDLDVSFLRVYEGGKPLQSNDYFQWSKAGPKEGELTFVTGHPGSTSRLLTIAELEFTRDIALQRRLLNLSEVRGMITEFQKRGEEQKRISEGVLFGTENSLKAIKGRSSALFNKTFFASKVAAENKLRKKIASNPKWKKEYGNAWDEIAKSYEQLRQIYVPLSQIENTNYGSRLFGIAKTLVRAGDELPKDNAVRFREFADSNLPRIKQNLFSAAPIYDELEIEMLEFNLTKLREDLSPDHPFVKKVLGTKSPLELATELVKGSKLKDIAVRQKMFDGGAKAVAASDDKMIQLARLIDPDAREIRKKYEDDIEPKIKLNSEKVAQAQFAAYGAHTYPDATFTLRISYGTVKGWNENGTPVKPFTDFAGAFARHTGRAPFALPKSWLSAKAKLDMNTPFDFATDNDIIGGNSGSPVINKEAQVVGLIFDGNIHSLGGDYGYNPVDNRAVAVDSAALIEALDKVYSATRVVEDLRGGKEISKE